MERESRLEKGVILKTSLLNSDDSNSDQVTPLVIFSTFVATCGSFSYGCAMGYSSAAQSEIMEELGLSVGQYSVFGSILTLGGAIGALFSGKIASLMGRRHAMQISEILCIVGWLSILFAKGALMLDLGRLSIGIGVGLLSYVTPVYIAEITPKQVRGSFIFSTQLMQSTGLSFVYGIGNLIHWRTLALTSALPCLVQLISLFFIPESPRWLAQRGQEKEFETALQHLRGEKTDITKEVADIKEILNVIEEDTNAKISDLLHRKYAYALTVGLGLLILQQLTGVSGIVYYTSSIFKKAGFSSTIGTTVLAVILVPKSLLGMLFIDKWGRRPLLMASASGMCFSCFLVGLSFFLEELHLLEELTPAMAFTGILGFLTMVALGMGGLPWIIMSEIFPINVKAVAGSLATLANWSTGWIITYTFSFMLQWNASATFFIFSGICGGTILFTWMLVPETNGRTLEQIHASILLQ